MNAISQELSKAIMKVMQNNKLIWGKDVVLLVSSDAVHYGVEGWGIKNYAPYGCDSTGYNQAVHFEHTILNKCLVKPDTSSAKKLTDYLVQNYDWHEYKWTWCGRYSVPFGLLTAYWLQKLTGAKPLKSALTDYSTSIVKNPIIVNDLNMNSTAPANLHHWVGYAVAGFK